MAPWRTACDLCGPGGPERLAGRLELPGSDRLISSHKNATTAPASRLAIQQAHGTEVALAQRFGVGKFTIRRGRKRSTVEDASHTPHRLQTTLSAGQEEIVVHLCSHLRLSLDDLLAVEREFIEPAISRSGPDRLLRWRGVNRLPEPEGTLPQVKSFKAHEPGDDHMAVKYLPQMQDGVARRYVCVLIDRATRWVFMAIKRQKTAAACRAPVAEGAEQSRALQDQDLADRKRARVHRPSVWAAQEGRQRRASVR
jgi:hypothetical protein